MTYNNANNLHNLTIGHCNMQGGLTGIGKTTEILQLIRKHNLDILSLNETNLNESIDSCTLNLPVSFDFIRKDRGVGSRGGCGLLISRNCAYKVLEMKTNVDGIEAVWVKIKSSNIHICGFYRSNNYCKIDKFIEYMSKCMSKLKGKRVIWIGDINLDQNKIKSLDYKKLDLTLKSFNMVQTIQGITRVAKRGDKYTSTTIDVIMTNCYADFESCCVLGERIGDHQAIKCEIGFSVCKAPQYEKIKIRNHSTANLDSFAYFLNDCDYSPLLECPDVESVALGLQEHLNKYYDEYCPVKSIRKHQNYIFKPSKDTLKAIRLKTKLYKKFKRKLKLVEEHRPYCNKCNICTRCHNRNKAWEEYTKQRNLVTKITKVNKRQNIVNDLKAKSTKNDLKGIWKTIKLAANIAPSTNTQDKNVCPLHPEELNQHFSTVGPKLQVEVPVYDHMSYTDFLPQHNHILSFSEFQEVSSSEIQTYIDTLSADKAIFDTIPIRVYKAILPAILEV